MSSSSIRGKTVRPGSLKGYSYYHSNRQSPVEESKSEKPKSRKGLIFLVVLVVVAGFWLGFRGDGKSTKSSQSSKANTVIRDNKDSAPAAAATQATTINRCEGNELDKFIKISITGRHLWACEKGKVAYNSKIISGLADHPETETPAGTYKIYGKTTNTTLTGSDSRGSWSVPVYYWMPFLDNQYGTYGFHDATWRAASDFGNIGPDSEEASHGCVELPIASSKWLYEWAPVGTTVTVET